MRGLEKSDLVKCTLVQSEGRILVVSTQLGFDLPTALGEHHQGCRPNLRGCSGVSAGHRIRSIPIQCPGGIQRESSIHTPGSSKSLSS